MQERHVQLARLLLGERTVLIAIWTESGNLEYHLQSEQGATIRVSPQDAQALAAMIGYGDQWTTRG